MQQSRQISIAVIGYPSSGKSYELYDLIHAFHVLGYRPQTLPLTYPYSTFGKFFFDVINVDTGGLLQTCADALRPENHYGAQLDGQGMIPLEVGFVNIPGEVFSDKEHINKIYALKRIIAASGGNIFWLATWRSPAGHELRLVLPGENFDFKRAPEGRVGHYRSWAEVEELLDDGGYKETEEGRRCVAGADLLGRLDTLVTDTLLLTIRDRWDELTDFAMGMDGADFGDVLADKFYPLLYCQNATDLIVCDRLCRSEQVYDLIGAIEVVFDNLEGKVPDVYLAFRDFDVKFRNVLLGCRSALSDAGMPDIECRNRIYSYCVEHVMSQLEGGDQLSAADKLHIRQSAGRGPAYGFWALLQKVKNRNSSKQNAPARALPPHVYFTATPIDADMNIYDNDTDVTRFIYRNGDVMRSFVAQNCADMSRHFCFGSLQLLIDILAHRGALTRRHKRLMTDTLRYFTETV